MPAKAKPKKKSKREQFAEIVEKAAKVTACPECGQMRIVTDAGWLCARQLACSKIEARSKIIAAIHEVVPYRKGDDKEARSRFLKRVYRQVELATGSRVQRPPVAKVRALKVVEGQFVYRINHTAVVPVECFDELGLHHPLLRVTARHVDIVPKEGPRVEYLYFSWREWEQVRKGHYETKMITGDWLESIGFKNSVIPRNHGRLFGIEDASGLTLSLWLEEKEWQPIFTVSRVKWPADAEAKAFPCRTRDDVRRLLATFGYKTDAIPLPQQTSS